MNIRESKKEKVIRYPSEGRATPRREEIIQIARDAGFPLGEHVNNYEYSVLSNFAMKIENKIRNVMLEQISHIVKEEREACAKACEDEYRDCTWAAQENDAARECAAAIRARGENGLGDKYASSMAQSIKNTTRFWEAVEEEARGER